MQAFEGINVVDFTHVLAGPFSTYQLAVMGASVIKIEGPRVPDMMRPEGYSDQMGNDGRGSQFVCQNGNKRSLSVDLDTEEGLEIVRKLVAKADVVVENFRGGVLDRKGLGYDDVVKLNPQIIYCSITGFGRTGPKAEHPAYDNVIQAFSGLMASTGSPDQHPVRVGPPVLDYGTGAQTAFAIAAALFQRTRTNHGQRIDVSMTDAALMLMTTTVLDSQILGETPVPFGNRNPERPGYSLYEAEQGQVMIGAFTAGQTAKLWRALDREDLAQLALTESVAEQKAHAPEHTGILTEILATKPAQHWEDYLNECGVPAARVRRVDESIAHAQIESREVLQSIDQVPENGVQLKTPVAAFGFDHDGPVVTSLAPALGEHTSEILQEIGLDEGEIQRMADAGVVHVADRQQRHA